MAPANECRPGDAGRCWRRLDGALAGAEFRRDPNFGFEVPVAVDGVDPALLDPRRPGRDGATMTGQALKLVGMFAANFGQ